MAVKKKHLSGPSGKHRNPQRLLSQTEEAWAEQEAVLRPGETWAQLAREALEREVKRRAR